MKVLAGLEPHLVLCKCQEAKNHVWSFESASRLRATFGLVQVPAGLEPHLVFKEEAIENFLNIVKTIFIDSNTFRGSFISNTSSDAWNSTFWALESHLVYLTRMTQLPPLVLPCMAFPNLVGTSRLLG